MYECMTAHCFMGVHAKPIDVGNVENGFCSNCRDEQEEETVLHILEICPAICGRRKRHFNAYYIADLRDLPNGHLYLLTNKLFCPLRVKASLLNDYMGEKTNR